MFLKTGWWETFVTEKAPRPLNGLMGYLFKIKRDMFQKHSR